VPLLDGLRRYSDVGTRAIAVTDHDVVTDLAAARELFPELILVSGYEHSLSENLLVLGAGCERLCGHEIEHVMARSKHLLTILCHPRPRVGQDYWTAAKIRALGRVPDAMEVYNGHYGIPRMLRGGACPLYNDLWDDFLSVGLFMWCVANDDFHEPDDFGNAFNMVFVSELNESAVLRAVKHGACYASTGLLLDDVTVQDATVHVRTAGVCSGRFVGPYGRVLAEETTDRFEYTSGAEAYLRFEGTNDAGRLFLQPMVRYA